MKLKLEVNGVPSLVLQYEQDEYTKIEACLTKLGLQKASTTMGWSRGESLEYYRETNQELKAILDNTLATDLNMRIIDNINEPAYDEAFNLAIFRVIPDKSGRLVLKLNKFLNVVEIHRFVGAIKTVLTNMFSIITDKEIRIVISEEKD